MYKIFFVISASGFGKTGNVKSRYNKKNFAAYKMLNFYRKGISPFAYMDEASKKNGLINQNLIIFNCSEESKS